MTVGLYRCCSYILLVISWTAVLPISAQAPTNETVVLPPGASNHGDPNLICVLAKWSDILIFYLGNYVAHAATIVSLPGSSLLDSTRNAFFALLFPVRGVSRGFRALFSLAKFAPTDLHMAARAGALCKVVRKAEYAQTIYEYTLTLNSRLLGGKVHGRVKLPDGYCLAIVPRTATFSEDFAKETTLSSDYNAVKILVAVGQLFFAIMTIYRSKGDQIHRYGYAAFGLTVTQYALMSLINLLGNLMCPQYPAVYLVESEVMQEAWTRPGAVFEGTIGRLKEDRDDSNRDKRRPIIGTGHPPFVLLLPAVLRRICRLFMLLLPTAISITIIGALSGFRPGGSTLTQRSFAMAWLAMGSLFAGYDIPRPEEDIKKYLRWKDRLSIWFFRLLLAAPVFAGFVIAGQMLKEYGVCVRLS
ncbi:MAG: hypothetical protein M1813_005910 [Trichoglossum hirsutum]|nr:MAG: hypothetical protein M1813_005910 [Trichoglossum hirsutum]